MNRLFSSYFSFLFFILICVNFINAQVSYESPGTYTWTVPPCVTEVTVRVWGAGGGAGGVIAICRNSTPDVEACAAGAGGGGGGYSSSVITVVPGQTYTIVVGGGGIGGAGGGGSWNSGITTQPSSGNSGGLSSFDGNGFNIQATGGTGGAGAGSYNNSTSGDVNVNGLVVGTGGIGSGGTINFTGGNGAAGIITGNYGMDKSGGGGGAAGPGGNGGNALHNGATANPPGGVGQAPGGNGGTGRVFNYGSTSTGPGYNGGGYGGGGGSGVAHRSDSYGVNGPFKGGDGANGAVIIEFPNSGAPNPPTAVSPQEFCAGATIADLTASGVNLEWYSQSAGGTSLASITPLTSNTTYYVSQTVDGCESERTPVLVNIHDPQAPVATLPVLCNGPYGTLADISVTGTTIQWYDQATGGTALPLNTALVPNTTYYVSQTIGNCESDRTPVLITVQDSPTDITISVTDTDCGQSNGEVNLGTVTGGTAPYQYDFNNQGLSSNTNYSNITGGNYSIIVSDANGCTYSTTVSVAPSDSPTAIVITAIPASCGNSNGSVTLGTVTGGEAPYQYNFNNLGFSSTMSFTNLAVGTYAVSVEDNNGCIYNTTIDVTQQDGPTDVTLTHTDASCNQADGTVTIWTVTGGTAPYEYNFNNQGWSSGTGFTGLTSGNYTVEVRDVNNCLYSVAVSIGNLNGPTNVSITLTDELCNQSNGTVTIGVVTGGTAPYQYSFNNQGFSSNTNYTSLSNGSYSIEVIDANNCTYSTSVTILNIEGPTDIIINHTNTSCNESDGVITIGSITGGTAPYEYNFNNQGWSSNTNFTGLTGGNYSIEVRDVNNCAYSTSVTINSTNGPTAIDATVSNASCGQANGSVIIGVITGGTAPYQYDFNGQGFSLTTNFPDLNAGNYTIVVRDDSGCLFSGIVSVSGTPAISSVITSSSSEICNGQNGTITIAVVAGGTSPYQFSLNNSVPSSDTLFTNLSAGAYPLTVIDASGCTYNTNVIVNQLSNGPQNIDYTLTPTSCEKKGSFIITNVYGGTAPYLFTHNGNVVSDTISEISSGNYELMVTDSNGCQLPVQLVMPEGEGEEFIHIPNVFTPNGDLVNDTWFISGGCIQNLECVIVNRWGEVMDTFEKISDEWDGKVRGNKASPGVYFYKAKVTFWSGETHDYHGHITLVD